MLSGSETPQSLGMTRGDIIRVQRYILVDVTPEHFPSSDDEATVPHESREGLKSGKGLFQDCPAHQTRQIDGDVSRPLRHRSCRVRVDKLAPSHQSVPRMQAKSRATDRMVLPAVTE